MRFCLLLTVFICIALPAAKAQQSLETLCQALMPYEAPKNADVGADYVPGVDVHGDSVVPADINSSVSDGFQAIEIPVQIDMAERYNKAFPNGVFMEPNVASIKVYPGGRIDYNGRDISNQAAYLCEEQAASAKAVETPPQTGEGDGRASSDPVGSEPEIIRERLSLPGHESDIIEGQYPEIKYNE